VTGTLFSLLGLAPSYTLLAILLLVGGISSSIYHAPAPAMIGHLSGQRVGRGLGLFMAGGEIGRAIGPILIAWAVSYWTLEGTWRLMFLGWVTTLVMVWRLRDTRTQGTELRGSLRAMLPHASRLFLPLAWIVFREFVVASMLTFLPTYMNERGASLLLAGASLSIWQAAGVVGSLMSGTLSDQLGRKQMLLLTSVTAAILLALFLGVHGWLVIPLLVLSGIPAMASSPVLQALVQEQLPQNRALANGVYVMLVFLSRPIIALITGAVGDQLSLQAAFLGSAVVSLAAIPAILLLPEK
jgi:FSR family fosmidomycin resistance protein-like MFS transporter